MVSWAEDAYVIRTRNVEVLIVMNRDKQGMSLESEYYAEPDLMADLLVVKATTVLCYKQ